MIIISYLLALCVQMAVDRLQGDASDPVVEQHVATSTRKSELKSIESTVVVWTGPHAGAER